MVEKQKYLGRMRQGRVNAGVLQGEYGYSFAISRNYRDKNDEWQETNFFGEQDLFSLIDLAQSLINKLNIKKREAQSTWIEPKEKP